MIIDERYADILNTLKNRLHIVDEENDTHLYNLLMSSFFNLKKRCGIFDLVENLQGQELVFERVRYAYNDKLEFFEENFKLDLNNFAFELGVFSRKDRTDETTESESNL